MSNHWLKCRSKRNAVREINGVLVKFVGHKTSPLSPLLDAMRKAVIKYFKSNPDKLDLFSDGTAPFEYSFGIGEQKGYVTEVEFEAD